MPLVNAGPDRFILQGGSTTLLGSGTTNSVTYQWSPATALNSSTVLQPVASPVEDITYRLSMTSAAGCKAFDDVTVTVLKTPVIPNTFSPNGDGIHDTWVIPYLNTYPGATVDLFNRYGQLVFHSIGYNKPWDGTFNGKGVPVGTYYYVIDPKNGRKQMAGFVDVIR
jgi:gliding motility-associated-like protein